nr:PAS domain-containing protein [Streptomyces caatingaensis]
MSSRPSRGAARLAAILDALPDALLLVNCNGTVVNANHIALETFEVPGTGLVGRGLLDLLPSFDSRRIPGSMRLPDHADGGRTKPTRMIARRTDGTQFPVEVSSANLTDGRTPYAEQGPYTGDELLMLVVRDLTGTLDTEAELARQQRQTEMILRAAAEGVVGVDTAGKVVLVNPSAAQILGYRASDLGGRELHPLIHHSRADGSPFPYEESPIADTLRSGRKHRVRGQVLWAKDGRAVPVDLTTAPVRDGDQLVGAVMTFTDRRPYDALAARHAQLTAVLDSSLRGPLDRLRGELGALAADPAGQLWPEANQILHHLAAGYGRMARLVDNVLEYQRLEAGESKIVRTKAKLDEVVAAGVEEAVELIGPGRAQFAVHAPAIEAEVDAEWFARALAHLIADVAGVDSTGDAPAGGTPSGDSTIVVAAAKRDTAVRIEVRGPYPGGDPVHGPVVRGIVQRHGGVLQTHDVPGAAGGKAYVLEVPLSAAAGPVAPADRPDSPPSIGSGTTIMPMPGQRTASAAVPAEGTSGGTDGKGTGAAAAPSVPAQPTGRRRGPARADEEEAPGARRPRAPAGTAATARRARCPRRPGGGPGVPRTRHRRARGTALRARRSPCPRPGPTGRPRRRPRPSLPPRPRRPPRPGGGRGVPRTRRRRARGMPLRGRPSRCPRRTPTASRRPGRGTRVPRASARSRRSPDRRTWPPPRRRKRPVRPVGRRWTSPVCSELADGVGLLGLRGLVGLMGMRVPVRMVRLVATARLVVLLRLVVPVVAVGLAGLARPMGRTGRRVLLPAPSWVVSQVPWRRVRPGTVPWTWRGWPETPGSTGLLARRRPMDVKVAPVAAGRTGLPVPPRRAQRLVLAGRLGPWGLPRRARREARPGLVHRPRRARRAGTTDASRSPRRGCRPGPRVRTGEPVLPVPAAGPPPQRPRTDAPLSPRPAPRRRRRARPVPGPRGPARRRAGGPVTAGRSAPWAPPRPPAPRATPDPQAPPGTKSPPSRGTPAVPPTTPARRPPPRRPAVGAPGARSPRSRAPRRSRAAAEPRARRSPSACGRWGRARRSPTAAARRRPVARASVPDGGASSAIPPRASARRRPRRPPPRRGPDRSARVRRPPRSRGAPSP